MSFFRYPGGKGKLSEEIIPYLKRMSFKKNIEYREPFFGSGSIGLKYLEDFEIINKIWINDKDLGISSLWTAVINNKEDLKQMVRDFKPSVEEFYRIKKYFENDCSEGIECGFNKLAIHQISYSGLGLKSGSPLGGKNQNSEYKIDCRWSSDYICKKIDLASKILNRKLKNNCCNSCDFEELIKDEDDAVLYLDPPYYEKGNELYILGFKDEDHFRLMNLLKNCKHKWVLSYDDCDFIRYLYSWAKIINLNVKYTIKNKKENNNKKEIVIINKSSIQEIFS